jgi:predicted O-linked N-acetylglucosamine transferase (SPINDLY family)
MRELNMEIDSHKIGWNPESWNAIEQENYSLVVELYEHEVESNPEQVSNLFYLGLAYLLNGEEDLAQMTWFSAIAESEAAESSSLKKLSNILDREAHRQAKKEKIDISWIIRQHIKEINPLDVINQIELVILSIKSEKLSRDLLDEWKTVEILKLNSTDIRLAPDKLQLFINSILNHHTYEALAIAAELSSFTEDKKMYCNMLLQKAHEEKTKSLEFAAEITKLCIKFFPENLVVLRAIYLFYSTTSNYKEAISSVSNFYNRAKNTEWELLAIYSLIREKTRGGEWASLEPIISTYKALMLQLQSNHQDQLEQDLDVSIAMPIIPTMLQYYQDNIVENRYLQNQLSEKFQENMIKVFIENNYNRPPEEEPLSQFSYLHKKKPLQKESKLKIGFLVSKLKLHSVGWLGRWLFKYYDESKFDFFLYVTKQNSGDFFTHAWFESKVRKCTYFQAEEYLKVVKSIYLDEVDILIDLDSTTSCESCVVMALKPAPIQATWLGFDASGIPAIDYFIVDPYLLPEDAQSYYREKLWRLPRTYLAVDGFEIEVPTLSRKDFDIPNDAVIFLSAQTGQKRNPNTVRLQLKILKSTPNGYLLIKGWGDDTVIKDLFLNLAREEEVDLNRLRFLRLDQNEFIHRANLQIADVILDTYPYNGATTTLEAMWMGVPIVTRLGQQCAARNSYTFLAQVGVTDGIATTDEEYVYWGIRFGNEPQLRQAVNAQLRQSRHTASVWDAKQFVRDMEIAWEEMWEIYKQNNSPK